MRVTQTISIGTLRINSMSNSSIVQIGTSGAVKTRSEEVTEVIPQAEANQKLENKIYNTVKPHLAKEGIPTVQQPLGKTDTGWNGPAPQQAPTGTGGGAAGGTGGSGVAHGDIGSAGSPNGAGQGTGSGAGSSAGGGAGNGAGSSAGNGASNGYGGGFDSSSWYVDGDAHGGGRRRRGTSDTANRGKTRT